NPLARGVLLHDATIGVIKDGADYALDARGTIELIGFDDVTAQGTIRVRANTFNHGWDEPIAIAGTDQEVRVVFADDETGSAPAPFLTTAGVGLQIKVFGQSFSGDVAFTKQTDGLSVALTNVELAFSDQASNVSARGPPFFELTNGHGTLSI